METRELTKEEREVLEDLCLLTEVVIDLSAERPRGLPPHPTGNLNDEEWYLLDLLDE